MTALVWRKELPDQPGWWWTVLPRPTEKFRFDFVKGTAGGISCIWGIPHILPLNKTKESPC